MNHIELGQLGEDMAQKYLATNGFKICERNYRFKKLEIDIIALSEDKLVIIEVKTRENNYFGEPYTFVTKKKQKQVIKAANQYIIEQDWQGETRFDIVSIVYNQKYKNIEHIADAFYPL
jgi:putative endonuclease